VKSLLLSALILTGSLSAFGKTKGSGFLKSYYYKLGIPSTEEYSGQSAGFDGSIKFDWTARNRIFKLKSDLEFTTDYLSEDSKEQFRGNPEQLYVEAKTGLLKFRGGFQTIVPEGPDILNPADLFHVKNLKSEIQSKLMMPSKIILHFVWEENLKILNFRRFIMKAWLRILSFFLQPQER
jgi:hypothetical protein